MIATTLPRGKSMLRFGQDGAISIGKMQIADFDKIGHSA